MDVNKWKSIAVDIESLGLWGQMALEILAT